MSAVSEAVISPKANNLHVYPSSFRHETRMLKETKSIANSALVNKVLIGAIWEDGLPEHEGLDERRLLWRAKLVTRHLPRNVFCRMIRFVEWTLRIFVHYRNQDIGIISCHCLSVLPLGLLFKLFCGSKVVYETHELETERNGWKEQIKKVARVIERFAIRYVDQVIVVGPSIGKWYQDAYSLDNVSVVRNVPVRKTNDEKHSRILRDKFQIADDDILFIYQGILHQGRSLEILLRIFPRLPANRHIVFMGYGSLEQEIKTQAAQYPNIHFHPAVPPQEITDYTVSSDVGLSLFEPTSLSYLYSCPNKMFEYIVSGVPVVVSDFPDMGAVVDEHACGWKVLIEEGLIERLLSTITKEDIAEKKRKTRLAREHFGWHIEEKTLLKAYSNCIS